MVLTSLFRRGRYERAGFELYGKAVAAARDPFLYLECGVPDTLDGRFDMIGLHTFLIIHRLTRADDPGPALAQAVFDAMFADMDINLREMGVGDLSVGRKVRAMWEAFHGRAAAYTEAMDRNDAAALEAALCRNVWRGEPVADEAVSAMARLMRAQAAWLSSQALPALRSGTVSFLPAVEASQ